MHNITPVRHAAAKSLDEAPACSQRSVSESSPTSWPQPGHLYDERWPALHGVLPEYALSRFSQSQCNDRHVISQRLICLGLSLMWLNLTQKDGAGDGRRESVNRMETLSSYDNLVNARTLHNFYFTEQKFLIEQRTPSSRLASSQSAVNPAYSDNREATLAATDSVREAGQVIGISLRPILQNEDGAEIPFHVLVKGTPLRADSDKMAKVRQGLDECQSGVLVAYNLAGNHALGFSVAEKNMVLFDPDLGEFSFPREKIGDVLTSIADTKDTLMIGAQIFNAD